MTRDEVLEQMKEELQGSSNFELEHMHACYNRIVATKEKDLAQAKEALGQIILERRAIIEEIAKRKKKSG